MSEHITVIMPKPTNEKILKDAHKIVGDLKALPEISSKLTISHLDPLSRILDKLKE